MNKLIKLLPALLFLLTLTGCIDVQYKMVLKSDGSGTIEETVYMNSAMVQMLKGFMAMGSDSTKQEEFSLFNEDELMDEAKNLGEGVRYISGKPLKEKGREGYKALYEFDDINKIKMNEDVSDKASPMPKENEPEDDITFKFTKGSPATLMIYMPQDKEEETEVEDEQTEIESENENEQDQMWTEEIKHIMKDFRIAIMIDFDGDIIETNATYVNGSIITLLEMSFDKIVDDPEKLKKLKGLNDNTSYEETREILKDIPGIKLETNEEVKVVFE